MKKKNKLIKKKKILNKFIILEINKNLLKYIILLYLLLIAFNKYYKIKLNDIIYI
jgi:hypothetical protein